MRRSVTSEVVKLVCIGCNYAKGQKTVLSDPLHPPQGISGALTHRTGDKTVMISLVFGCKANILLKSKTQRCLYIVISIVSIRDNRGYALAIPYLNDKLIQINKQACNQPTIKISTII